MPVRISANERPGDRVQFAWCSLRTTYSLAIILFGLAEWLSTVHQLVIAGVNLNNIGAFNFYIITSFEAMMLGRIAMRWSELMRHWDQVDAILSTLPYREDNEEKGRRRSRRLSARVKTTFSLWLFFALGNGTIFGEIL